MVGRRPRGRARGARAGGGFTRERLGLEIKTPVQVGRSRDGLSLLRLPHPARPVAALAPAQAPLRRVPAEWEAAYAAGLIDARTLQAGYARRWPSPPMPMRGLAPGAACAAARLRIRWRSCSVVSGWRSKTGADRVIRGGSWNNNARNCRSAYRNRNEPDNRNNNLGFRCARAHDRTGRSGPEQTAIPGVGPPSPKPKGPRRASSGEADAPRTLAGGPPLESLMPMSASVIDTAWHPLADGCPPEWASEWGQDRFGVFIAFTLGEVTQRCAGSRRGGS